MDCVAICEVDELRHLTVQEVSQIVLPTDGMDAFHSHCDSVPSVADLQDHTTTDELFAYWCALAFTLAPRLLTIVCFSAHVRAHPCRCTTWHCE
jgi:hypothetical protein